MSSNNETWDNIRAKFMIQVINTIFKEVRKIVKNETMEKAYDFIVNDSVERFYDMISRPFAPKLNVKT